MSRPNSQTRLNLLALESRVVPSATLTNTGALMIEGTAKADSVVVYKLTEKSGVQVLEVYETVKGKPRPKPEEFLAEAVDVIVFHGRAGNDSFNFLDLTKTGDVQINAYGGTGNDTLVGAGKDDLLMGEEGADKLQGYGGDDKIIGGGGSDRIWGGIGNDLLYGNVTPGSNASGLDGMDVIYGEAGNDYLDGGQEGHPDMLVGGIGEDVFVAEPKFSPTKPAINVDKPRDYHPSEGDQVIMPDGQPWE